ncbi:MAG: histidine phosphatase family protein [Pseudomonadota bacterium]
MKLHLVRHGETQATGRLLGRTDAAPTPDGIAAARAHIARTKPDLLLASPLRRAKAVIGDDAAVDPDWSELDFGAWDGKQLDTLDAVSAGAFGRFLENPENVTPPQGESWPQFRMRVARGITTLLEAETENALVVTHAGAMRTALHIVCGWPFRATWAVRIDYATRLSLNVGHDDAGRIWGELLEVAQP